MRKLASIREIAEVIEIPGAEKIELVRVDGWQCVAQKGEFKQCDKCCYFEIDSILPDHPVFEFMRPRKFRVKTIKCMKQMSQGLAKPISDLSFFGIDPRSLSVGDDVTEKIGVTKYDDEEIALKDISQRTNKNPWWKSLLMRIPFFRKLLCRPKGTFPNHIVDKTDETRMENLSDTSLKQMLGQELEMTEKIDGTSTTVIFRRRNWWQRLLLGDEFLVCSRNLTLVHEDNSWWWNSVKQNNLREEIEHAYDSLGLDHNSYIIVQGETIGKPIQGNRYNLKDGEFKFLAFSMTVNDSGRLKRLSHRDMKKNLKKLQTVPLIDPGMFFESVSDMVSYIKSRPFGTASRINPSMKFAEGVVVRTVSQDPNKFNSFKWVYPEFLERTGQ